MNYAIVLRLLSYILYCEAALLLLPAMASLIYGEWMVLGVFLLTAALSAAAGALLHRTLTPFYPENIIPVFQQKHKGKYGIYSALVTFLALG